MSRFPEIDGIACIALAFILLILPSSWVIFAILAAGIHELFHILAIVLTGGRIRSIRIGLFGAEIATCPMSSGQELLCALAGPAGSLLLLCFLRLCPVVAFFGLFQGLYNLLPLYPLDGGRALRCFADLVFPEKIARVICRVTEHTVCIVLIILSAVTMFLSDLGIFPFLLTVTAVIKVFCGKISCKESFQRVQ